MGVEGRPPNVDYRSREQSSAQRSASNLTNLGRRLDRSAPATPVSAALTDPWVKRNLSISGRSVLVRYGVAVLAVLLAGVSRWGLTPAVGDRFQFLTFYFALVLTAWFGGLGPSIVALVLSLIVLPWVLSAPGASIGWNSADLLGFQLFGVTGLAMALMGGSMRMAQLRSESSESTARKKQSELEEEVAERRKAELEKHELLQAQQSLRALAEKQSAMLANLLEQVPVGVTLLDPDLRITKINAYASAMAGEPPERLVGQPLRAVLVATIGPQSTIDIEDRFREVLKTGESFSIENWAFALSHRPDETFFADWKVRRVEDSRGEAFGLLLTLVDVTEHVRREHALRASEERFRTMANAAPVMIWAAGADKRCHYFNMPWLDSTGRTAEQEWGEGWTEGVHPDDRAHCVETFATA